MLEIDIKRFPFKRKEIWFSDQPFDVNGFDSVSFFNCLNKVDNNGFKVEEATTIFIDTTKSLDDLWKDLDKTTRKKINSAKTAGFKLMFNEHYDDFLRICDSFREKKGLPKNEYNADFMKKYGILIVYELNGEIMGGTFFIKGKNRMRGLLSASKRLEVDKDKAVLISKANKLTFWEAICYAQQNGIQKFDMGGYYTGEKKDVQREGINFFKSGFGGEIVTIYNYQKDYSILYKLGYEVYKLKADLIGN
jgi:lipid II:glycine glycyltransferase (peptidoglycan interpeptide bridge formation enzyme)